MMAVRRGSFPLDCASEAQRWYVTSLLFIDELLRSLCQYFHQTLLFMRWDNESVWVGVEILCSIYVLLCLSEAIGIVCLFMLNVFVYLNYFIAILFCNLGGTSLEV